VYGWFVLLLRTVNQLLGWKTVGGQVVPTFRETGG